MLLPSQLSNERRPAPADSADQGVALCGPLARALLASIAVVALGLSGYLAVVGLSGSGVVGCDANASFNCDQVLSSRWSKWLGIPVAVPAVMLYGSALATLGFLGSGVPSGVRRVAWWLLLAFATSAAAAAIWFTGLQVFSVKQFCVWCLATHATGVVFAITAWIVAWRSGVSVGGSTVASLALAGPALAALVVGQLVYQSDEFRIERETPGSKAAAATPIAKSANGSTAARQNTSAPSSAPSISENANTSERRTEQGTPPLEGDATGIVARKPPLSRKLSLATTGMTIDVYEHPIIGSPDAEHVIVKLFDYTCHHCRDAHLLLEEARKEFGDRLAIVVLPVPMNGSCNQYVPIANSGPHMGACAYAKLALAVWRTDRSKFAEFHHWLFSPDTPPPYTEARAYAKKLLGDASLQAAYDDFRVIEQLNGYVEIYGAAGKGDIPKLIDDRMKIIGRFRDGKQLIDTLNKEWSDRAK